MTEEGRKFRLFGKQIFGERHIDLDPYEEQAQLGEVPPSFVPMEHLVDDPQAQERILQHAKRTGRKVEYIKGAAGRVTAYIGDHKYQAAVLVGAAALATYLASKEVKKHKRKK